ncbi:hypothetical protein ACVBE9_05875 [Eionea flava]
MMNMFNSVARKREKGFLVTRETLVRENVDTVEKAETCQRRLQHNAFFAMCLIIVFGGVLAFVFSSVALPIVVGVSILCLYVITSTYRAKSYVQRYIEEMLDNDKVE